MTRKSKLAFAVAAVCMSLGGALGAAPFLWDGGAAGSPNWTDPTNWSPDGVPANDGTADITFGGIVDAGVNVNVAQDVLSLTFNNTAGGFVISGSALTIRGGGITNNDANNQLFNGPIILGAAQTWNTASGALTINGSVNNGGFGLTFAGGSIANVVGAISGAGALTKNSAGSLLLTGSADNTYTGLTTVNAGILALSRTGVATAIAGNLTIGDGVGGSNVDIVRLGASNQISNSSTVTITTSGRLDLQGFSDSIGDVVMTGANITGTGASELGLGGSLTTLPSALSSNITVPTIDLLAVPHPFNIAEGADLRITGAVINGGIVKNQRGLMFLLGTTANSLTGATTVNEGALILAKSAGIDAINGAGLAIGEAVGTFTDSVILGSNSQIADSTPVSIGPTGRLDLNGFSDNIAHLGITGGAVATGTGRLGVTGVATGSSSQTATISGTLGLLGGGSTFNIADGSAAVDLDVSASVQDGNLIKVGAGTLRLAGATANTHGQTSVDAGVLILAKSAATSAIPGALQIASSAATPSPATVRLEADHQIADSARVTLFNGGSNITTGIGTLTLNGAIISNETANPSSIAGRLHLNPSSGLVFVGDGAAATELSITADISGDFFVKRGSGELRLSGNNTAQVSLLEGTLALASNNALGTLPVFLEGGTITAVGNRTLTTSAFVLGEVTVDGPDTLAFTGNIDITTGHLIMTGADVLFAVQLQIGTGGAFTMERGTVDAPVHNHGLLTHNGGDISGTLINDGTIIISRGSLSTGGLTNNSTINLANGQQLIAGSAGLQNAGLITLSNSMLSLFAASTNNGSISGHGMIFGTAGFTNNGLIIQEGGSLIFNTSAFTRNHGNIDMAPGRQLSLQGSPLENRGTINLNGGIVNGTRALNNLPGGTIAGRGSILAPFNNNGGLLLVQNGTTNISTAFSSSGTIQLAGIGASLVGGPITSSGTIQGAGSVGNSVDNAGTIEAVGGTLIFSGSVDNVGTINASTSNKVLFSAGLLFNNGIINLTGGTFDNNSIGLINDRQISGYGTFRADNFLNNGTMTFSGGVSTINGNVTNSPDKRIEVAYSPAIFTGDVVNNGIFKNTDTTITFAGSYTENGLFLSDPADNLFNNVSIGAQGAWVGGYGDRFIISGDLISQSNAKSNWQTSLAELRFTGGIDHILSVMGDDLGLDFAGYEDNFAWGSLWLGAGDSLVLEDANLLSGGALYVDQLHLAGGIGQVAQISSNGLNIYYNLSNPNNAYLQGKTYSLSGGGSIAPVPESSSVIVSLIALSGLLRGRHRPRLTMGGACL